MKKINKKINSSLEETNDHRPTEFKVMMLEKWRKITIAQSLHKFSTFALCF